jgi:hypothetical protein
MPVFPRDKRVAFARRSCFKQKIERGADSTKRIALYSNGDKVDFPLSGFGSRSLLNALAARPAYREVLGSH